MIRRGALSCFAFCFIAGVLGAGCASPGDPSPRHPTVPVAVSDLSTRQAGNAVVLAFTLPARSLDGEALAEPPALEIYRAEIPAGFVPDRKTVWRLVYSVPPERVASYRKGDRIEFQDPLAADDAARGGGSLLAYKVRTRASKAKDSEDSNIASARIYPAPQPPGGVHVTVTESALLVRWDEAAFPSGASSRAYRVYRGEIESGHEADTQNVSQTELKAPLELAGTSSSNEFRDSDFEFGTVYLYTVRSVAQFGPDFVESADSPSAVVTPRDVFPPAAPTGLEIAMIPATSQAPAYVELSWAISPEGDLAGYSVYRSNQEDTPGDRANAELLLSPTFRDMSVRPGGRYFYRVSALDRSGNESPKSSAVQADIP
jgi:hypothetical protein